MLLGGLAWLHIVISINKASPPPSSAFIRVNRQSGGRAGRLFRTQASGSPPASPPTAHPPHSQPTPAPRFAASTWGTLERGGASVGPARGPSGCACGATRADLGVGQLVVFFPLHSPVLEPNLNLAFREAESVGDLHPPAPRQVAVVVKFFLQLQDLLASVGGPRALGLPAGVIGIYWTHTKRGRKRKFYCPEREEGEPFLPANTVSPSLPLPPSLLPPEGVGMKEKAGPQEEKETSKFWRIVWSRRCCLGVRGE